MFAQRFVSAVVLSGSWLVSNAIVAQETQLTGLISKTPSPGNAVAYLHTPSLRRLVEEADFSTEIPANISEVSLVANIDIGTLAPHWEAGYASLTAQTTLEELASRIGGYVDTIGSRRVVWTPQHSYLIPGDKGQFGFLRPANRSLLSSWLRAKTQHHVDDYLARESEQPEAFLSFMLAVALEDAFSPVSLKASLSTFNSLNGKDLDQISATLAGCRGVSLIVGRKSLADCILSIEFNRSPQALLPICQNLIHDMLSRNGTPATEVLDWKPIVEGNKLLLRGPISDQTLSRVLSILTIGGHASQIASIAGEDPSSAVGSDSSTAYRTKDYFREVIRHIESVRNHHAKTTGSLAKWNDIQARRIDEIYVVGVDELAVEFGVAVARALRNDASAIRNININAGKSKASSSSYGGYGGGYYGNRYGNSYNNHRSYSTERGRIINSFAQGNAYQNYREMLKEIDQRAADVRRELERRYQMPF